MILSLAFLRWGIPREFPLRFETTLLAATPVVLTNVYRSKEVPVSMRSIMHLRVSHDVKNSARMGTTELDSRKAGSGARIRGAQLSCKLNQATRPCVNHGIAARLEQPYRTLSPRNIPRACSRFEIHSYAGLQGNSC